MRLLSFSLKAVLILIAIAASTLAGSQGLILTFTSRFQYAAGWDILATLPVH